jgi:hypothetical protein
MIKSPAISGAELGSLSRQVCLSQPEDALADEPLTQNLREIFGTYQQASGATPFSPLDFELLE